LKCHGLLHLLLRFESNDPARHCGWRLLLPVMVDDDKAVLRRRLRSARRAVGAAERLAAAQSVDRALKSLGLPRPHSRVAAYQAMDGEIDPTIVLHRALALGCEIHFPVIASPRACRMRFAPLTAEAEPAAARQDAARWLDLVLVPLVGFDADANRLGMGAGYYDRHFAFLRQRRSWRKPLLLGLAFDLQRVDRLPAAGHDVPLWGIVTERAIYGPAAARARARPASAGR
ncbi:MAG: 5-formyltetrahydrofolate cyclo-ligase, partial [Steroidobacteraceae bacterium]